MPITPRYEWTEAETSLSVDIKMRAVKPSSTDILMTDCYAKVNCAPYFFEADLYSEIDPRRSSAAIGQDAIKFFFIKKEPGLWGRLTLPGDRKMIIDRRHRSLVAIREQAHKDREDFPAKLSNIGRLAVGEQMKLEEARRKAIEKKKEEELKIEQDRLKSWMVSDPKLLLKNTHMRNMFDEACSEVEKDMSLGLFTGSMIAEDSSVLEGKHRKERLSCTKNIIKSFSTPGDIYRETVASTWLPAPRRSSSIQVNFSVKSDRPVHLPARESRDKVVRLKKKDTANVEASNPTEREPIFLQDKADKFFRSGDYNSAINAYTSALEADSSFILSLANRAACRLHMGQHEDCITDCFKALQLLQHVMPIADVTASLQRESLSSDASAKYRPEEQTEQISLSSLQLSECLKANEVDGDPGRWEAGIKKRVLLLRGSSKYHEGNLQQALEDYVQALQFEPAWKELEHIVAHIEHLLKGDTP